MALHTLGGRYAYSNVPYDEWTRALAGTSLSEAFGWTRNHYDRLVHFAFGALVTADKNMFVEKSGRFDAENHPMMTHANADAMANANSNQTPVSLVSAQSIHRGDALTLCPTHCLACE